MIVDSETFDSTAGAGTFAADLRGRTRGTALQPGDDGFATAVAPFNLTVQHRPDAVLLAADAADVAAGISVAGRHGRCVAVQATGHGAAATTPGTLLISTRLLDRLEIDPTAQTATVGAGVRWQQVLDAAAPYGLTGLAGSAPDVGVVGYTLGGGLGPVARTYGFAADRLISVELVTADGRCRTVDAVSDPELFAALRGGGGAFGVVVAMTFGLVELPSLYAGGAYFHLDVARTVLQRWAAWSRDLPAEVTTSIARLNLPPDPALPAELRGASVVHLRYAYVGDPAAGGRLLAPMLETAPPLLAGLRVIPAAALGSVHADPTAPMPVVEGGVLLRELPSAAVECFVDITSPGSGLPVAVAELRLLGGALRRGVATGADAITGREAAYHLQTVAVPGLPSPTGPEQAVRLVAAALAPWSTGEVLHNFAGADGEQTRAALRDSWGPDRQTRLLALRDRLDPNRVFGPMARW